MRRLGSARTGAFPRVGTGLRSAVERNPWRLRGLTWLRCFEFLFLGPERVGLHSVGWTDAKVGAVRGR